MNAMNQSKTPRTSREPTRVVTVHDFPILADWQFDFLADLFGQVLDLESLAVANDDVE